MWRFLLSLAAAQVVFLAEVSRHGSRAPLTFYPWDNDGRWTIGSGELTAVGMRQHFLIGSELRQRYGTTSTVIPSTYNASSVYFRSTDYNRTLMSAESQLSGVFPPPSGPSLSIDLAFTAVPPISVVNSSALIAGLNSAALPNRFQSFPVHTVPDAEDFVLQAPDACQLLGNDLETVFASSQYAAIASSNPWMLQVIEKELGVANATGIASSVIDNLLCNRAMGYTVPATLTDPQFWANATQVFNAQFAMRYHSDQDARLYSSGFFQELIPQLQKLQQKTESTTFRYYSAHDDTIGGILSGLQAYDNKQPPFASTLLFEVSEVNYGLSMRVIYNDQVVKIPGCDSLCPLSQFVSFLQSRAYSNLQSMCSSAVWRTSKNLRSHRYS